MPSDAEVEEARRSFTALAEKINQVVESARAAGTLRIETKQQWIQPDKKLFCRARPELSRCPPRSVTDRELVETCEQEILRNGVIGTEEYQEVSRLTAGLPYSSGERGIELSHTTILRWVQRYVPEFEKRWSRYARPVSGSWRCDETYIKVKGRWTYLYRAVDKQGRTVDFLLTAKRDVAAAKRFFQKAMNGNGTPRVITLDAYAASHRAVRELKVERKMPKRVRVRSSKYLNNGIEQDHRRVKQRIRPMLGFQRFPDSGRHHHRN